MNHEPWSAEQANAEIDSRRALLMGLGGLAAGAVLASSRQASAGPLNPPAGPVGSTGATLTDIRGAIALTGGIAEPRRPVAGGDESLTISLPGSYYLTGPRFASITISASDVTLDLSGFAVQASPMSAAVRITGERVKVHNGVLRGLSDSLTHGVAVDTLSLHAAVELTDLRVFVVNASAVRASAGGVTVRNVRWLIERTDEGSGIQSDRDALVSGCIGSGGRFGIAVGPRSLVRDCVTSAGVTAIVMGRSSLITHSHAEGQAVGLGLNVGCSAESCTIAGQPGSTGISASGNTRISRCLVLDGAAGIEMFGGANRIENCRVGNATNGIISSGIDTIVDCSLNAAAANVGTGIELRGQDCHVDGNYIYAFGTGIRLPTGTSRNVITRNRLLFNSTAAIGGGTGPMVAEVLTNITGGVTNPWANLRA